MAKRVREGPLPVRGEKKKLPTGGGRRGGYGFWTDTETPVRGKIHFLRGGDDTDEFVIRILASGLILTFLLIRNTFDT